MQSCGATTRLSATPDKRGSHPGPHARAPGCVGYGCGQRQAAAHRPVEGSQTGHPWRFSGCRPASPPVNLRWPFLQHPPGRPGRDCDDSGRNRAKSELVFVPRSCYYCARKEGMHMRIRPDGPDHSVGDRECGACNAQAWPKRHFNGFRIRDCDGLVHYESIPRS